MPRHFNDTYDERYATEDEYLAHYGIKGMKWGRRRGSLGSRIDGAQSDRIQRRTELLKRAVSGQKTTAERIAQAPERILLGKKRLDKMANKQLGQLADRQKRIDAGKKNFGDKLDAALHTTLADLVVSRQDNKTAGLQARAAAKTAKSTAKAAKKSANTLSDADAIKQVNAFLKNNPNG